MKWLFLTVLIVVAFFGYRTHKENHRLEMERIAALNAEHGREEAERRARDDAERKKRKEEAEAERQRREAEYEAERQRREAAAQAEEARLRRPIVSISKTLEPLLISVTAPLDTQKPYDLVPQTEITKQRVLDKQARAEPERRGIYDKAAAVFDALIALGEERTKMLEEMLRNNATQAALDQPRAPGSTGAFFNRSVQKRWDDVNTRFKPALAQRMEALRAAERAWNATLHDHASEEQYELPSIEPVVVTVEQASSPLRSSASANGRVSRGWRRTYYDQNNYRYPTTTR